MKRDIFIAYSRKDIAQAEAIESGLEQSGLRCYRDVKNIPGSAEWMGEITAAVEGCHAVLAILSSNSVQSQHVQREFALAVGFDKPFIPVFLSEHVKLPKVLVYPCAGHQQVFAIPSVEAAMPAIEAAAWRTVDRSLNRVAYEHLNELNESNRITFNKSINFAADRGGLPVDNNLPCGRTSVENGTFIMASNPRDYLGLQITSPAKVADFILDARLTKFDGPDDSWFGFEYGERFPGNYYQFLINGQGAVRISKHWNSAWCDLGCHQNVRQLRKGSASNSLQLVRKEAAIHIFVNERHALSAEDWDVRAANLGLVVGWGLRVGFSDLKITGMDLPSLFNKALDYWEKLEVPEALELLNLVKARAPEYGHPGWATNVSELAWETRPDRRRSVLIAVGTNILPQIHDGAAAAKLRDEINRRGRPDHFEFACVITDTGLLLEPRFRQCPLIAVGGPAVNKITSELKDELARDSTGADEIIIQHAMASGDRRIALWGATAQQTTQAVDLFIRSELFERYLKLIWERAR